MISLPSHPHGLSLEQLAQALQTDTTQGLSPQQRQERLEHFGLNQLQLAAPISPWKILLSQFQDLMVLILLGAALIALLTWKLKGGQGLPYDAIVIASILVLNALLGFVQEYRAEQMMQKLKEVAATSRLRVISQGESLELDRSQLVPGDVVKLQEGDRVPADCILLRADRLKVDESLLTGESLPVSKTVGAVDPQAALDARSGSLFAATSLSAGSCTALVVGTGNQTELGRLAKALTTTESEETPLQRRLARLGTQIGWGVLAIATVVGLTVLLMEGKSDLATLTRVLMFSVALAVAAVPEGLPAVLTVALAIGTRRLAQEKAVVRKMSAVETLGSLTVIATDKTGTLTHNQMTVRAIYHQGQHLTVEGEGYQAKGELTEQAQALLPLLRAGVLASSGDLIDSDKGPAPLGDPVDVAMLVLAEKAQVNWRQLRRDWPELAREPFNSERARMTSLRRHIAAAPSGGAVLGGGAQPPLDHEGAAAPEGGAAAPSGGAIPGEVTLFLKGSLEAVGQRCRQPLDLEALKLVEQGFAESALRVLALAQKTQADPNLDPADQEQDLEFLGLVAMGDPPRAEAREAVQSCRAAGLRVVMATGDHPATALAIARQVGLADPEEVAITGPELEQWDDQVLAQRVQHCNVFARVSPAAKLRLVEALLAQGHIVAMTGDGVNDAPALKKVHVGVAMGSGTAVAVEASQVVLLDDNFATIVKAVAGGRRVYRSLQKFIAFLFSGNLGVVVAMFLGAILAGLFGLTSEDGLLLPLTAAQILWMNLAVDGAPAVAFSLSRSGEEVMKDPPRSPTAALLTPDLWRYLIVCGLFVALALLTVLDLFYAGGWLTVQAGTANYARTAAFYTVVCTRLWNALNFRHLPGSVFSREFFADGWVPGACLFSWVLTLGVIYFPPLQKVFDLVPLEGQWVLLITCLSSLVLIPGELQKRTLPLRLS